jgi:acyl-CoA reductase-like NAD-dependent aldehyde dehydrogenase
VKPRQPAAGFRLASEEIRYLGGETIPTQDANKLALTLCQPRGLYAVVTAWNFPINIPVEYLAPAVATIFEETFGPVAPILAFKDDDEALSIAMANDYGLTSSVFTKDLARATKRPAIGNCLFLLGAAPGRKAVLDGWAGGARWKP